MGLALLKLHIDCAVEDFKGRGRSFPSMWLSQMRLFLDTLGILPADSFSLTVQGTRAIKWCSNTLWCRREGCAKMKLNSTLWSILDSKLNLETVMCLDWFHWPSIYLHVSGSNVMWLHFPARHRGPLKYVSLNHWGLGSATANDFRRWAAFHISCGALDSRYTICYLLPMSLSVNKSVRSTSSPGNMWGE